MLSGELARGIEWARLRRALARLPSTWLLVRGGRPRLLLEGHGRAVTPLAAFDPAELPELIRVIQEMLGRPPHLRSVRRIEVHTWDGAPVRSSEAAAAFLAAGFGSDGPRRLRDGFPGPRPRG